MNLDSIIDITSKLNILYSLSPPKAFDTFS
jgi:hypothetical protein